MCSANTVWARTAPDFHLKTESLNRLRHHDLIIAFSGGADSVALVTLLQNWHIHTRPGCARRIYLYHLDHCDQSSSSVAERESIISENLTRLQQTAGISAELIQYRRPVSEIARKLKLSFERTGSLLRRRHMRILSRRLCAVQLWGHHLSDWYETREMRLLRSSSERARRPFSLYENNGIYLLHRVTRTEIRENLQRLNIRHWDDPENSSENYTRIRLRRSLPPVQAHQLRKQAAELSEKLQPLVLNEAALLFRFQNCIKTIAENREYRIRLRAFNQLSSQQKITILEYCCYLTGLWPIRKSYRPLIYKLNFQHRLYTVETENWGGDRVVVIRRGRRNIKNKFRPGETAAALLTKSYTIERPYGRKSVRKIFSELKLSERQLRALPTVICIVPDNRRVKMIRTSVFGLEDITEFRPDSED